MKKLLLGSILLVAALAIGRADAADIPAAPVYTKAPVVAAANDWTGFYVGASVGARWSDPTWTTNCIGVPCTPPTVFVAFATANPSASFDDVTARLGGYFGYNWQFASQWVGGLEGDVAWGDGRHTMAGFPGLVTVVLPPTGETSSLSEGSDGSVRARLGFLVTPSMLLYGTGGLAWQQVDVALNCTVTANFCPEGPLQEKFSTTKAGWTLGAGVDGIVWGNWIARLEYRYSDYGTVHHTFFANAPVPAAPTGAGQVNMSAPITTNMVTLGLAYKFGPSVASQ